MPRKTSATETDGQAAEPRRSARISSQPKTEAAPVKERKTSAAKSGKKRSMDQANEQANEDKDVKMNEDDAAGDKAENGDGSNKKAKPATPDSQKDELESDVSNEAVRSLSIGDSLPSITLKNEKGDDVNVAEIANESGVVMFLVPKADTPGCTAQACGFRDVYKDVEELGYKVYCLSADTSNAQEKWQTKNTLPYSLLSDPQRTLIKALGAAEGTSGKLRTKRSHFIFEKGGKLVDVKNPVKPADSPKFALEFIKKSQA